MGLLIAVPVIECFTMVATDNAIEPSALGLVGDFQNSRGGRRRQQHPWETCGSRHFSALQGDCGVHEHRLPVLGWL